MMLLKNLEPTYTKMYRKYIQNTTYTKMYRKKEKSILPPRGPRKLIGEDL